MIGLARWPWRRSGDNSGEKGTAGHRPHCVPILSQRAAKGGGNSEKGGGAESRHGLARRGSPDWP